MAAEKNFENKIKDYLDEKNAWYIKYWAGSKFTKEGIPDILACIAGKFYGIEVKAEHGRPKLLQLIKLRNIRSAGGFGILLYPKDFIYFMALVEGKEIGQHWYKENILFQREWFNRLSL